jgi:mannose-6-phosphate isomerase-like protein (cupin superfamily)
MANVEKKNLDQPDQTKQIGRLKIEVIKVGGLDFQRITAGSGWRWSEDVKPVAKTESCQVNHLFQVISGNLHVKMNDGKEMDFKSGDIGLIPAGHDGWTVGNKPAVWLEYQH